MSFLFKILLSDYLTDSGLPGVFPILKILIGFYQFKCTFAKKLKKSRIAFDLISTHYI